VIEMLGQERDRRLRAGELVAGRYRIEEALGHGMSGLVYAARSEPAPGAAASDSLAPPSLAAGTPVALKVLHAHLVLDEQLRRRFDREARILRKLRGPNLASVLDSGRLINAIGEEQLFIVLERVAGTPLDQLLQAGALPASRAIPLALDVVDALLIAHAEGVVHRDLKPQNVVVELLADGRERARVLDFGMAKILRGNLDDSLNALTQQNMVFGTPEYMAPEQARGDEVDERADLYATGVLLYEMLTGRVPFQTNTPIATMTAHLVEEPVPPSARAPDADIPPRLERLVLKALSKRPAERHASASELRAELARCAEPHESPAKVPALTSEPLTPAALMSAPLPGALSFETPSQVALRDTALAVNLEAQLRKTEPSLPAPHLTEEEAPLSRGWMLIAVLAAVFGILIGLVMSTVGTR
jgi:serine/threonine-protein kinase